MCPCIGLGLSLQQDDVIVEGNNAIPLIRQLIDLSKIAFQTFALFSKRLKQALVVEIGRNPFHRNGLAILILITVVVREADQHFAIGQVGDQARGGRNTAAIRNGLDLIRSRALWPWRS